MKKKSLPFLSIVLFCLSCSISKTSSFNPAKKFSSAELKKDFLILTNILDKNHPGLYWYASADSINQYFSAVNSSLDDSLTEPQFKNKVSWAVSKIHCGHTTVRSSKKYANHFRKQRLPLFPLSLKVWEDSAVVISDLLRNDEALKRGTIITGINKYTTREIIDSICQLVGTDGFSNNFKYQLISFNFPAYYKNTFGTDSLYLIKYLDSLGNEKQIWRKNFEAKADTQFRKQEIVQEGFTKKQVRKSKLVNNRNLKIDTANKTAYLSVNTFSEGKLNRFFRNSFETVRKQEIKNLVLDLRLNSGGSVIACTRLTQYLIDKPFHVADTVAAFTRELNHKRYIKPWFIYWLSMHLSGRRMNDDRIHFRFFEKRRFKPKTINHFDGNIFVLTGGYTFSAASLVAEKLKGQRNVSIIGEETGGGAHGNSAMFLTTIVLPHTKLRITLPLYRMVLDANHPKDGRGVLPDVLVKPSSVNIKSGIDAKLMKVREMINSGNPNLITSNR